jgi:hypothetical protein
MIIIAPIFSRNGYISPHLLKGRTAPRDMARERTTAFARALPNDMDLISVSISERNNYRYC